MSKQSGKKQNLISMADLGEGLPIPPYFGQKKKKRLKEEKPAGQVN